MALGAALSDEHASFDLGELEKELRGYGGSGDYRACPPLFTSPEEYERFAARHARAAVRTDNPAPDGPFEAALGIDAGSTTVKAVVTDLNGGILYTRYQSNTGDPVAIVLAVLRDFTPASPPRSWSPPARRATARTSSAARSPLDAGVVETVAHFTAAKLRPAGRFHHRHRRAGHQVLQGQKRRDRQYLSQRGLLLGLRLVSANLCGRAGLQHGGIRRAGVIRRAAGRSRLALHGVYELLGQAGAEGRRAGGGDFRRTVDQRGQKTRSTRSSAPRPPPIWASGSSCRAAPFLNDAVLRAFEQELNTEVTRPGIPGLMGAYGAALYALAHRPAESTAPTAETLRALHLHVRAGRLQGCTNACRLSVSTFAGNRRYISGNKCDKPLRKARSRRRRRCRTCLNTNASFLQSYRPVKGTRGTVGIPMGLNFYENLPFWHAFFTALGYEVIVSPALHAQPLPARAGDDPVRHGLLSRQADARSHRRAAADGRGHDLYPCMSYNFDEQLGDNHFNCPVVAYYPEVAAANIRPLRDVRFIYDYLDLSDPEAVRQKSRIRVPPFVRRADRARNPVSGGRSLRRIRRLHRAGPPEGRGSAGEARRRDCRSSCSAAVPIISTRKSTTASTSLSARWAAVVISEDALGGLLHRAETGVLNQWTYHARLYAAAEFVCAQRRAAHRPGAARLVRLRHRRHHDRRDAPHSRSRTGKIYTQIKIDEITNLGAVRIRLRSLFSALDDTRKGGGQKQP